MPRAVWLIFSGQRETHSLNWMDLRWNHNLLLFFFFYIIIIIYIWNKISVRQAVYFEMKGTPYLVQWLRARLTTHMGRLEPFHKLQLTPEIAHSSSAVALSSVPGAKHLICGLMTFSKSSVSTYLIVNAGISIKSPPRTQVGADFSGAEPQFPPWSSVRQIHSLFRWIPHKLPSVPQSDSVGITRPVP